MYKVVVGIPTYKRPEMLQKLLLSILDCEIDRAVIRDVDIVVVDNDADRTAEVIVRGISFQSNGLYKLTYHNYPVKGLSNVRNELFKIALTFMPDYIVSIDDDEFATKGWLNQLIQTITKNEAEIVIGPVIPVFEHNVSPYISGWFKYKKLPNNERVYFFWTGNFIISADFLLKHQLEFDDRFNKTGSEDSWFGVKARNSGARIIWANDAVVYETIPAKRARLKWLVRRSFNGAVSTVYMLKLQKKYLGIAKKTVVSLIYFMSGGLALAGVPLPFRWKYWGILKLSEGVGGFAGLVGFRFQEYSKDR
jgi:succinoglycan biosynthesis protein ExoM